MNPAGEDPAAILEADAQWTEPWGTSEHGSPCEKCAQTGMTEYRCWSCLLTNPSPDCPACAGRIRWREVCPVCRGSSVVDGAPRRGVSIYPKIEGLYHYMLVKKADLEDCLVVELEARRAPDVDFDADQGALLVIPTAIHLHSGPDRALARTVRERAQAMQACS